MDLIQLASDLRDEFKEDLENEFFEKDTPSFTRLPSSELTD